MSLAKLISSLKYSNKFKALFTGHKAVVWALSAFLVATIAVPQAGADSASLDGAWRGSGWINFDNGKRERARCKARYSRVTPDEFTLSANCATASAKATQTARVHRVGKSSYSGSFFNKEFGVTGSIYVKVQGRSQSVRLSGTGGTASFSLRK
jgi:hypothetical protein